MKYLLMVAVVAVAMLFCSVVARAEEVKKDEWKPSAGTVLLMPVGKPSSTGMYCDFIHPIRNWESHLPSWLDWTAPVLNRTNFKLIIDKRYEEAPHFSNRYWVGFSPSLTLLELADFMDNLKWEKPNWSFEIDAGAELYGATSMSDALEGTWDRQDSNEWGGSLYAGGKLTF